MSKKLRIGVVGAGSVAQAFHIPTQLTSGYDFVGVCDPNEAALNKCLNLGLTTSQIYTDLEKFLAQKLDAVSVCVPNKFHKEVSIACLEAGVNVLCEKPPAMNADEVQEMIEAAEKAEVILTWQFNNRFRPEVQWLFNWESWLGDIKTGQVQWIRRNGIPGWGSWFTREEMSGGGPIIDLLIHMLDLLLYAMDYPEPSYVMATSNDLFGQDEDAQGPWCPPDPSGHFDVETASQGMILFPEGKSILFRASWAERIAREVVSCIMQGEDGGALIERIFDQDGIDDTAQDRCVVFTQDEGQPADMIYKGRRDPSMGRTASIMAFLETVATGRRNYLLPEPEQALIIMKIIDAIYVSADSGEPVAIE